MKPTAPSALLFALAMSGSALAADWPQWRGPAFNGSTDEKNLPVTWSKESGVLWSVDLAGPSASTPSVVGDRVFISTSHQANKTMHAMCLDRKTGKVLWEKKIADGFNRDNRSNFSSPSPVADASRVIFFFGNGPLVAFDHAGKELWARNITKEYGEFAFQWTFSATPLLYGGKLYVQVLQRDVAVQGRGKPAGNESYLLALDPATGKELWRQVRPSEAVAESHEAYTTPLPITHNGRTELLIAGGDCLTGHDPATGRELWRWGTWNPTKIGHWRLVVSPSFGGGVVLACAPKGDPIFAIKAGGNGTLTDAAIAWKSDKRTVTADVPTPLFYQGDFFVLSDLKKNLSRVDPATGEPKWTLALPGMKKYEASPTGADGKIYLMNFAGDVVVVDATKGEVIGNIPMGEPGDDFIRSTIVAAHGQLFIRTNAKLFCIGKK
jgi:outer membrane protein assembly factor BamB